MVSVPTQGEVFARLIHHLREAQSCVSTLAHLAGLQSNRGKDQALANGWLLIERQIAQMVKVVTALATRKLQ